MLLKIRAHLTKHYHHPITDFYVFPPPATGDDTEDKVISYHGTVGNTHMPMWQETEEAEVPEESEGRVQYEWRTAISLFMKRTADGNICELCGRNMSNRKNDQINAIQHIWKYHQHNMKTVYLLATPDDRVYTIYDPTGYQLVCHPLKTNPEEDESNTQKWVLTARQ